MRSAPQTTIECRPAAESTPYRHGAIGRKAVVVWNDRGGTDNDVETRTPPVMLAVLKVLGLYVGLSVFLVLLWLGLNAGELPATGTQW